MRGLACLGAGGVGEFRVTRLVTLWRDLSPAERVVAATGACVIAGYLAVLAGYLLTGHALLRIAHTHGVRFDPSIPVAEYLTEADRRIHSRLLQPLLVACAPAGIALAWAFRRADPLRTTLAFWRAMPLGPRTIVGLALVLPIVGQALGQNTRSFPFVRWDMYAGPFEPDRIDAFHLYGLTPAGERVHLNIGRTFPSIHRGAPARFRRTALAAVTRDGGDPQLLDEVVRAVARQHSRLQGVELVSAEIVEVVVERAASGGYDHSSQVVRTVALFPDGLPGAQLRAAEERE